MSVSFSKRAWDEYLYWSETDKKMVRKINELIEDIGRNAYAGIGKPEPLKHEFAGYWSRRITDEHRLVYRMKGGVIRIIQLRYHY